jgi:hypothetical protein
MTGLRRGCVAAVTVGVCLLPLLAAAPAVFTRPVTLQGAAEDGEPHPYCAVLDASVFAEAAPGLRGLHLMQDGAEIPLLTTVSEPQSEETDVARVLHLREQDGALSFDLEMPERAYTELEFHLHMQDFVATAEISAGDGRVGEFKLFDLSREHLARETTMQLSEMHDRTLHVTLRAQEQMLHAVDLEGVDVLPDRAAQSVYTGVATTATFANTQRETIAEVDIPAHVPVQRIRFETTEANFLRRVRVEAWPENDAQDVETISGTISSTRRSQNGIELADTQLVVPMTLGANLQGPAHVRVIVENDGETPLALRSITLEMREHKMCFDAKSDGRLVLMEGGDSAPDSPAEMVETRWESAGVAVLGAASASASFDAKDLVDVHPSGLSGQTAERIFIAFFLVLFASTLTLTVRNRKKKKARK